ncbi:MAG: DUF423 domain-containing protein [Myxococcota bacterium]|nr:DUF423 domain-containing protein [Myxococcota bacterium]
MLSYGASVNPLFLSLTATSGLLAVALGAFGAHGLKSRISPELLQIYQTAVQYHFAHTFALGFNTLALAMDPTATSTAANWFFVAGILLFSGSLYLMAITSLKWWGAITPIGGTLWIVAWGLMIRSALMAKL